MRKLYLFLLTAILATSVFAKSPHGEGFNMDCSICHTTVGWNEIKMDGFNHDSTSYPLVGQHKTAQCRKCHVDLKFSITNTECNSCHEDVHQQTVGQDCKRCHTPKSWIVQNIKEIHQQIKFPLVGRHTQIECHECHKSDSLLRFEPIQFECVDCHLKDYIATKNPDHATAQYPKDCTLCHNQSDWQSETFNHNNTAFPLTGSHIGLNCNQCHANGYKGTSTACASCHKAS